MQQVDTRTIPGPERLLIPGKPGQVRQLVLVLLVLLVLILNIIIIISIVISHIKAWIILCYVLYVWFKKY